MPDYTRDSPKQLELPPRLPLIGIPNQRGADASRDSRLVNGYVEFGQDEVLRIVKRPGLTVKYTLSGYGAGMFENYSVFYTPGETVDTGTLYLDDTSQVVVDTYAVTEPDGRFFSFARAPSGGNSGVFLHNTYECYFWNGPPLDTIPFADQAVGPLTCGITNLSTASASNT